MRQKNQVKQFNDREIEVLQSFFGDDDTLLFILRKVMFQFELLPEEKGGLRGSITSELIAVLKKLFIREFEVDDMDTPLGQKQDFLFGLTEGGVFTKDIEEMSPIFKARKLEMDYLKQQLEALKNIDLAKEPIKFKDLSRIGDDEETYTNIIARNHLIFHIDTELIRIKGMSVKETPEEIAKRERDEKVRGK